MLPPKEGRILHHDQDVELVVVMEVVAQAYLQTRVRRLGARAHLTDPGLLDQLALAVVVGHPGGDACPAAFGTLGPGRGLNDALVGVKHLDFRLWSVS